MTYTAGRCEAVTVNVTGPTPEALDKEALGLARQFFGEPDFSRKYRVQPYTATPVQTVKNESGQTIRVVSWEADVTVQFREQW